MLWLWVVLYVVLSPLACLLIGCAIRVRDEERPVEVADEVPEPVAAVAADVAPVPAHAALAL